MSALLFSPLSALRELCHRNRALKLFQAVARFELNGENAILVPAKGKTGYLADRVVRLVLLLLPVWRLQRLFLLINDEYQVISLQGLEQRYPALSKAQGRFDHNRRVEQLEQNGQCFEAILSYLKSQGTLYKIDASGVYLEAFYREANPRLAPEQLIGRSVLHVLPPENEASAQAVLQAVRQCITTGVQMRIVYPIWERHYQATLIPIKDQNFCYVLVNQVSASSR